MDYKSWNILATYKIMLQLWISWFVYIHLYCSVQASSASGWVGMWQRRGLESKSAAIVCKATTTNDEKHQSQQSPTQSTTTREYSWPRTRSRSTTTREYSWPRTRSRSKCFQDFSSEINTAIPSYLIFCIIVWKWCVRSCFLWKNGSRWPSLAAIFPQKATPHTSLSHYNAKYQITRNSRIEMYQLI